MGAPVTGQLQSAAKIESQLAFAVRIQARDRPTAWTAEDGRIITGSEAYRGRWAACRTFTVLADLCTVSTAGGRIRPKGEAAVERDAFCELHCHNKRGQESAREK